MLQIEPQALNAPGDALPRPHDNCYWLIPGQMLAGEHPGAKSTEQTERRADALINAGVRCVIDLTEATEGLPPSALALQAAAAQQGQTVHIEPFPIADYGVPSAATMRAVLAAIDHALRAGELIYLHCHGGIGRTGTVVGCWLVEQGFTPDQALHLLAQKWRAMAKRDRAPVSPETDEQRAFIAAWQPSAGVATPAATPAAAKITP